MVTRKQRAGNKKRPGTLPDIRYGDNYDMVPMVLVETAMRKHQIGKGVIDKIKQVLFFPPNKLPGDSQRVFDKYKHMYVTGIEIAREPISSAITKFANWASSGKFNEKLKELGYDKAYHLYMLVKLSGGRKILIEKNERVNIKDHASKGIDRDIINIPLGGLHITLDQFLNKTRELIGDHDFFQYSASNNNCQKFLQSILNANGLSTNESTKFILQDAKSLFESLPGWAENVAQFVTDTAGKVSQLVTGQGKRRKYTRAKKTK